MVGYFRYKFIFDKNPKDLSDKDQCLKDLKLILSYVLFLKKKRQQLNYEHDFTPSKEDG